MSLPPPPPLLPLCSFSHLSVPSSVLLTHNICKMFIFTLCAGHRVRQEVVASACSFVLTDISYNFLVSDILSMTFVSCDFVVLFLRHLLHPLRVDLPDASSIFYFSLFLIF